MSARVEDIRNQIELQLQTARIAMATAAVNEDRERRRRLIRSKVKEMKSAMKDFPKKSNSESNTEYLERVEKAKNSLNWNIRGCLPAEKNRIFGIAYHQEIIDVMQNNPPARAIEIAEKVSEEIYGESRPYDVYANVSNTLRRMVEEGQAVRIDVGLRCPLFAFAY